MAIFYVLLWTMVKGHRSLEATVRRPSNRVGFSPAYREIYRRIRDAIDTGRLGPGDRIPSARGMASELGVAHDRRWRVGGFKCRFHCARVRRDEDINFLVDQFPHCGINAPSLGLRVREFNREILAVDISKLAQTPIERHVRGRRPLLDRDDPDA
jgi:hypothetical protein